MIIDDTYPFIIIIIIIIIILFYPRIKELFYNNDIIRKAFFKLKRRFDSVFLLKIASSQCIFFS